MIARDGGWSHFWFSPEPTTTLGLVRISYGVLAIAWTMSLLPDLATMYSDQGLVPSQPGNESALTWLARWDSPWVVAVLWALLLVAAVGLTVGAWSRIAAVLVFVAMLSFQRRNPDALNSGDVLLRLIAFYLALAPSGAALSLDRWRAHRDSFWQAPLRSPWALRLLQVQVSLLYLFSVFYKVRSDNWSDGTAMYYITHLSSLQRVALPDPLTESLLLMNVVTYTSLAIELALGILIWNRRARPWVITCGVALHLGIETTMLVGFFSLAIFVCYVAFVPADTADRWVTAARREVRRRRRPGAAHLHEPV